MRFVRAALPHMRARGWGRIVAIQSMSVKQPVPFLDLSNGIRPGIAGLTKALMPDLAKDGITINLVLPGMFATARIHPGLASPDPQERERALAELKPLAETIPARPSRRAGRAGRPGRVPRLRAGLLHHRRRLPGGRRRDSVEYLRGEPSGAGVVPCEGQARPALHPGPGRPPGDGGR